MGIVYAVSASITSLRVTLAYFHTADTYIQVQGRGLKFLYRSYFKTYLWRRK